MIFFSSATRSSMVLSSHCAVLFGTSGYLTHLWDLMTVLIALFKFSSDISLGKRLFTLFIGYLYDLLLPNRCSSVLLGCTNLSLIGIIFSKSCAKSIPYANRSMQRINRSIMPDILKRIWEPMLAFWFEAWLLPFR